MITIKVVKNDDDDDDDDGVVSDYVKGSRDE